jgi:hypothetical protein
MQPARSGFVTAGTAPACSAPHSGCSWNVQRRVRIGLDDGGTGRSASARSSAAPGEIRRARARRPGEIGPAWPRAGAACLLLLASAAVGGRARADCAGLCFLDAQNRALDSSQDAVQVSRFVTNGPTLPRADSYAGTSSAPTDLRIQLDAAPAGLPAFAVPAFAVLESRTRTGLLRASLRVALTRPQAGPRLPLRSPFVRLVGDETDRHARGAQDRTLRVGLRDYVVARFDEDALHLEASARVGQAGDRDGPNAARLARVQVHVLRTAAHGRPVIGRDDLDALKLMRQQLEAANEIWLQCDLSFGPAAEVSMEVVDPPPPCLLSVADDDGLPARGGGEIRFRVGGVLVGPISTGVGASALSTAREIAAALSQLGFYPTVSENLATRSGAGPSADVLVRHKDGTCASVAAEADAPLSSDPRQSLRIGVVDLSDGLQEFDNISAQVGSLEERALIKPLSDDDPGSIDLFVVDHFSAATRQGEAFIADPLAPIVNTVVIDRNGLRHLPLAWTLAHELGHVLMNDPLHPDNVGPDRPWLLMDADSGRGTVDGPKRLREEDCARMREAARTARVPLLRRFDPDPSPG